MNIANLVQNKPPKNTRNQKQANCSKKGSVLKFDLEALKRRDQRRLQRILEKEREKLIIEIEKKYTQGQNTSKKRKLDEAQASQEPQEPQKVQETTRPMISPAVPPQTVKQERNQSPTETPSSDDSPTKKLKLAQEAGFFQQINSNRPTSKDSANGSFLAQPSPVQVQLSNINPIVQNQQQQATTQPQVQMPVQQQQPQQQHHQQQQQQAPLQMPPPPYQPTNTLQNLQGTLQHALHNPSDPRNKLHSWKGIEKYQQIFYQDFVCLNGQSGIGFNNLWQKAHMLNWGQIAKNKNLLSTYLMPIQPAIHHFSYECWCYLQNIGQQVFLVNK